MMKYFFIALMLTTSAFAAKTPARNSIPLPEPRKLHALLQEESLQIQIAGIDREFAPALHRENLAFARALRLEISELFQERELARR